MSDCFIMRKVPFRLSGTTRLTWGVVVCENQGLALVFVPKPNGKDPSHQIVIGTENPAEHVFEAANNVCQFAIDHEDLGEVGNKLRALAENLSNEQFRNRFFSADDAWWKE